MDSTINKIAVGVVALFIVGAIALVLFAPEDSNQSTLLGEEIEDQGREHIDSGSQHPPYSSNPPTSGPHWGNPQPCSVYDEPVPDEAVIHSLEHGAIWITYRDQKDSNLASSLKDTVERDSQKVILSPRPTNESEIALVSWGRLLKLEAFDDGQISSFIKSNKNNAPEPFASC